VPPLFYASDQCSQFLQLKTTTARFGVNQGMAGRAEGRKGPQGVLPVDDPSFDWSSMHRLMVMHVDDIAVNPLTGPRPPAGSTGDQIFLLIPKMILQLLDQPLASLAG